MLTCKKCEEFFFGTSGRQMKHRLADHRGYIFNQVVICTTGAHFNLPGHRLADLSVTIQKQTK